MLTNEQQWRLVEHLREQAAHVSHEQINAAAQLSRPCVVFKAELHHNHDNSAWPWTASFSKVCGHGDTPAQAMAAFDKAWFTVEGRTA